MQAEVFASYYRRKEDYENYYKFGLQFLAYTPATELTVDEHKQWATRMGMAVLLGRHIFNISELVSFIKMLIIDSWTNKSFRVSLALISNGFMRCS